MLLCSEMHWCFKYLFLKIFFVSILLQCALCIDILEGEQDKGILPLTRLDKSRFLKALDEKSLTGGLIANPRLGRRLWELAKTLIPYPRHGRLIVDPESLDYDILFNADYGSPDIQDLLTESVFANQPGIQKRRTMKLIPRIGRKKRSIADDEDEKDDDRKEHSKSDGAKSEWDDIAEKFLLSADKKAMRSKAVFAPRIGKKDANFLDEKEPQSNWNEIGDFGEDYSNPFFLDKKGMKSKAVFAPRIGKKEANFLEEYLESKRAAAFTPRIGRAALIPRIGRNDPRFRLKSRSSFIPRIGRRAAFIPRVGRSEKS